MAADKQEHRTVLKQTAVDLRSLGEGLQVGRRPRSRFGVRVTAAETYTLVPTSPRIVGRFAGQITLCANGKSPVIVLPWRTMEIDGITVDESSEVHGYSWRWDDPRGFESEILWDRQIGHLTLGTRVPPGGWTHGTLDTHRWGRARTINEARTAVERYVTQAVARVS